MDRERSGGQQGQLEVAMATNQLEKEAIVFPYLKHNPNVKEMNGRY